MSKYVNTKGVTLPVAVWLATDNYDYNDDPKAISTTTLLKSVRQIVLSRRMKPGDGNIELTSLVPSRMGTSFHDSIEAAWTTNHVKAMEALGYPKKLIERIKINPDPTTVGPDDLPVYLELRSSRSLEGWTVNGKFDFVGEGRVNDFKSTGVFTYQKKVNDEKFILQGSIYRWLNPGIITDSTMAIQYIFTDWQAMLAHSGKNNYPPNRIVEVLLPLKSVAETENYIRSKLIKITELETADEADLPECNDEELWRREPVWKYYKNPANTKRSTKNYDNFLEAQQHFIKDGGVGLVKEIGGEVIACLYCDAYSMCTQKDALILAGSLKAK